MWKEGKGRNLESSGKGHEKSATDRKGKEYVNQLRDLSSSFVVCQLDTKQRYCLAGMVTLCLPLNDQALGEWNRLIIHQVIDSFSLPSTYNAVLEPLLSLPPLESVSFENNFEKTKRVAESNEKDYITYYTKEKAIDITVTHSSLKVEQFNGFRTGLTTLEFKRASIDLKNRNMVKEIREGEVIESIPHATNMVIFPKNEEQALYYECIRLVMICLAGRGLYDSRCREMVRTLAFHLSVPWIYLCRCEYQIAKRLHSLWEAQTEEEKKKSKTKNDKWRYLKVGAAATVGGVLIGVTGGLAAPAIAVGLAAFGTTTAVTLASFSSAAIIGTIFGTSGSALVAWKMTKRTEGITDMCFIKNNSRYDDEGKDICNVLKKKDEKTEKVSQEKVDEEHINTNRMCVCICVSGWLTKASGEGGFESVWGTVPAYNLNLAERLKVFYKIHNKLDNLKYVDFIADAYKGRYDELHEAYLAKYGASPFDKIDSNRRYQNNCNREKAPFKRAESTSLSNKITTDDDQNIGTDLFVDNNTENENNYDDVYEREKKKGQELYGDSPNDCRKDFDLAPGNKEIEFINFLLNHDISAGPRLQGNGIDDSNTNEVIKPVDYEQELPKFDLNKNKTVPRTKDQNNGNHYRGSNEEILSSSIQTKEVLNGEERDFEDNHDNLCNDISSLKVTGSFVVDEDEEDEVQDQMTQIKEGRILNMHESQKSKSTADEKFLQLETCSTNEFGNLYKTSVNVKSSFSSSESYDDLALDDIETNEGIKDNSAIFYDEISESDEENPKQIPQSCLAYIPMHCSSSKNSSNRNANDSITNENKDRDKDQQEKNLSVRKENQTNLKSSPSFDEENLGSDILLPWWDDEFPFYDHYMLRWEPKALAKLGNSVSELVASISKSAAIDVVAYSSLAAVGTLVSAMMWPIAVVQLFDGINGPWTIACEKADAVGKILAEVLIKREHGNRPVVLMGYSMGSRVIVSCIRELYEKHKHWLASRRVIIPKDEEIDSVLEKNNLPKSQENGHERRSSIMDNHENISPIAGLVQDVVLMGTPVTVNEGIWNAFHHVCTGRVLNCYSKKDWMLRLIYRYQRLSLTAAGISPIPLIPGVENVDISAFIENHNDYPRQIQNILRHLKLNDCLSTPFEFNPGNDNIKKAYYTPGQKGSV